MTVSELQKILTEKISEGCGDYRVMSFENGFENESSDIISVIDTFKSEKNENDLYTIENVCGLICQKNILDN